MCTLIRGNNNLSADVVFASDKLHFQAENLVGFKVKVEQEKNVSPIDLALASIRILQVPIFFVFTLPIAT